MEGSQLIPKEQDDCLRFVRNPYRAKDVLPPGEWTRVGWIQEDLYAFGIYETQGLVGATLYLVYVTKRIGPRRFIAMSEYNQLLRTKDKVKKCIRYLKEALGPRGGDNA